MKLAPISSGSQGNCILLENENTSLLIDAGISKKKVEEGLDFYSKSPNEIDGILITHEHSDHIKGLGVFLRKYPVPVYGTEKTLKSILDNSKIGEVNTDLFYSVSAGKEFSIKNLDIGALSISHDAADPVCYKFSHNNKSCAVVTDLGFYDYNLVGNLKELDTILIESNHDINMLQIGPYPYSLKQRIWGQKGHLSNEACGRLLNEILSDKLKHIILGHLSKENNYPELAFEAVRNEINFGKTGFEASNFDIKVASRTEPSCMTDF